MTEISTAFGPSSVSYDTVRRWKKKFESGVESIKNAPKSGRPKSASRKEIVSKIKEIMEGDARFTVRDIARKVGISLSTVHLILKKHLRVRKISARWVPHLLTDEQKRQRVKVAKKLLQMFPKYDKKQFANVVTGDEIWVHYFEPVRKVSNKFLIVLGFNDTSTLEGHFVSSPREREKRDRRESRGDERERQGRKRNRNESEETEEIKTFPLYPYPLQG